MKIFALLGALQGIVLIIYIFSSKKNRLANINFLIGLLLCIAQMFLVSYVENPYLPQGNLYLKLITWVLPFIIPVFAYFYLRFLAGEKQSYRRSDWLYALPFLLGLLALWPFIKLDLNNAAVWEQIDPHTFALQGLLHMFGYSAYIIILGLKMFTVYEGYKIKIKDLYSNFEAKQLAWIRGNSLGFYLIGITGIIGSLLQLIKISNPVFNITQIWTPDYLVFIPVSILFYWYGYKVIQVPELFRLVAEAPITTKEKYSHSVLEESVTQQIARQLLVLMEGKKMYLNPHLKLTEVASELAVSKQVLSQVLNQHFEQNFYDFINNYRLAESKEKLVDPNLSHLSIQGIALESGFKSKSTFYELFKKNTGLTPRQFQKS